MNSGRRIWGAIRGAFGVAGTYVFRTSKTLAQENEWNELPGVSIVPFATPFIYLCVSEPMACGQPCRVRIGALAAVCSPVFSALISLERTCRAV